MIYPLLIYGIITWGNTSSALFKKLNIIKLTDLIKHHISIFMFQFHNQLLPSAAELLFHEQQQKSVIIFQKQGLIMDCLVSDIKDLKFGI